MQNLRIHLSYLRKSESPNDWFFSRMGPGKDAQVLRRKVQKFICSIWLCSSPHNVLCLVSTFLPALQTCQNSNIQMINKHLMIYCISLHQVSHVAG